MTMSALIKRKIDDFLHFPTAFTDPFIDSPMNFHFNRIRDVHMFSAIGEKEGEWGGKKIGAANDGGLPICCF